MVVYTSDTLKYFDLIQWKKKQFSQHLKRVDNMRDAVRLTADVMWFNVLKSGLISLNPTDLKLP